MRRWRRLDDGSTPGRAELELQRDFLNELGHAAVFAVGDIHSIEYGDDTFFIRVTGVTSRARRRSASTSRKRAFRSPTAPSAAVVRAEEGPPPILQSPKEN